MYPMSLNLYILKHEDCVHVVSFESGEVIDTDAIRDKSFVPSEYALSKASVKTLKSLLRQSGYSIKVKGKRMKKDNYIEYLTKNWAQWLRDVAVKKGVRFYFLDNETVPVTGDVETSEQSEYDTSEIQASETDSEDGSREDEEPEAEEDVMSKVIHLNDNINTDVVGNATIYMENDAGEKMTYRFYFLGSTTFKELFQCFFIKTDIPVGDSFSMKMIGLSGDSPTIPYETLSSWGDNIKLKVVPTGLTGGGKRGYGAVAKVSWEEKAKALKETLDVLGLRVQNSTVAQVNGIWAVITQAKDNAMADPSNVMTTCLDAMTIEQLKKIQSTLFQTNVETKLASMSRVFFVNTLPNLESLKSQYDATMEATKHVIHLLVLSEFHAGDTPSVSWQSLSDTCVRLIAEKSAATAVGTDAAM